MEGKSLTTEMQEAQFSTFPEIFDKFRQLSAEYGNMPMSNIMSAFTAVSGGQAAANNPYIQNRRVKRISSLPESFTKDDVAEMIAAPDGNETKLRQVAHALEYTAYPMFHIRRTYQDMLTYHNYVVPRYTDEKDAKSEDFKREWRLVEKLRRELDPKRCCHEICGQAFQEGKVFYTPRVGVDKVHNRVNHAFMQQLPSDWIKIVGFNNISKYTVAFNLFYFMQPGTSPLQFGDLFSPYMWDFQSVVGETPRGAGTKTVFAEKNPSVDFVKLRKMQEERDLRGSPDVYCQNGRYFYWVTLPVDKVFTFETDDVGRNVVSPFTGIFVSMIQMAQYEQIQLELVQNPLVSLITGEIPYRDDKELQSSDPYKMSNAGRKLFESLFYQMLQSTNTSGIGLYMAPLNNMQLHQLAEAPSASEISARGYAYTMQKAGLSAIVPTTDDPKVGISQISLRIESRFGELIYGQFERMFGAVLDRLNLKYGWALRMFGNVATDDDLAERLQKDMTLGILPSTLAYMAMQDVSLLDDVAQSSAVMASGIMDRRLPIVSSYSAKQEKSRLPPQAKKILDGGGRPKAKGAPKTEGQEKDLDSYGE